jgi:hypothetical protein
MILPFSLSFLPYYETEWIWGNFSSSVLAMPQLPSDALINKKVHMKAETSA